MRLEAPPVDRAEEAVLSNRAVRRMRHSETILWNPREQLIKQMELEYNVTQVILKGATRAKHQQNKTNSSFLK